MGLPIDARFSALEKFVNRACDKKLDEQEASYLCKLGSVLVCGNLERCVEIAVVERLERRSPPQISAFLRNYFKAGRNYDCEQIAQLLHRFDSGWGKLFEGLLTESVRSSISSCYAVRNSVAHGGAQSLGQKSLRQYFEASFQVVVCLESAIH
ncbi:HEPN domain-containing protein [Mesorhizobium sp. M0244]|uniref:HEPN domain-containing protein n=1 Tax=Mesorhizobium sp. M0244 TaxID=2956926 RepID=UPI00333D02FE